MLEAMASGVPPIVTVVSGTEDAVEDGKTGITFDAGSDDAYSAALRRAIALNQMEYETMSREARRSAENNFDIAKIAQRNAEVYADLRRRSSST
jgi:glycosyltransferase involved in cell wall biosynthesis